MESILNNIGYQNNTSPNVLYAKNIGQSIKDSILTVWYNKVENGSRCTNYRIFKQTLGLEFYLTNLSPQLRLYMCRFRCGYNRLPVNKFKLKDENEVDKVCKLCNLREIGDEFHYIFKCSHFQTERNLYLNRYYISRPNTQKMQQLFNTRKKKTLRNLAKFQGIILSKF